MHAWRFDAIGTRWEIETAESLGDGDRARIQSIIGSFDETWSRFRDDSVVSALRERGGSAPLDPDAAADAQAMLDVYRELDLATHGAVNPLIGAALEALGYDAALSLQAGPALQAPGDWRTRLRADAGALVLEGAAVIDVGAVGKGRLVDLISDALEGNAGRVTVDGSGDLRVRGGTARVALEHPYDPAFAIGVVEVADAALCASGVTRRSWAGGLHHVLDGRTGLPVRTWAATWALAGDALHADAVATALFFDGGPPLADRWGVEWVRMSTDGRVERSAGFPGEVFTAGGGRRQGGEDAEE
ncbi:FAD:protein FMN transferase [Microbacterium esteraromaticum]|uniref:FAD:protein FMN transferase n=1 Tax=Microbacterium esteraromaticum TaxID=57043 RepID=UPI00195D0BF3|nr:FAD:protein FMN transferase [Microbacterium esteraromaticum]MBM7465070.1 thiamine biosynthesis lipoprotein [Microbacterium esteraromaticum]